MKREPNRSVYNKLFLLIFLLCIAGKSSVAQLFNQDSLKLISSAFAFTEGPAVNKKGDVFFTDQPNNQIWKYGTDGKLSLFSNESGRANGLYFGRKGELLACADDKNELWSISEKGKVKVLLSTVDGKKLNGPNDLWVDSNGGVYFTDPYYQRSYWARQKPEIEGQKVYYLPPGKKSKLIMVAEDLTKPNGIVGSVDGKYLFVADIARDKTYRYTIGKDGRLSDQQIVINKGADGITIDRDGNLYLSGKGVFIYSPAGVLIGHIEIKEPWTANVCFGGKERSDLFITASTSIYTIPMHTRGVE